MTDADAVRLAVLIDSDNTTASVTTELLDEIAKYGTPTIKRAYGDFSRSNLSGWTRELNARAIRAIHQNAFTTGKNSTDSALIIDAMDLLYANNVEAFAIVTSDSDFTSLAMRLRESGKTVYGLGRERTPMSLQNACDQFIDLELLGAEDSAEETPDEPSQEPAPKANPQSVLTKAVNATAGDDGWANLSAIGNHIRRSQPAFDPRRFGHAKLGELVAAQPYLETKANGATTLVRLKQARKKTPAKKTAAKKSATKKQ